MAPGLHSLSSDLFAVLLQHISCSKDKHSLLCTSTAVRDMMLQTMALPDGPLLTYDLHTYRKALIPRHRSNEQLCMRLWLKEGPRLYKAYSTAVRAAGQVQLRISGVPEETSAQLTQLMAVGTWQHLTVIHLKGLDLDQLVPEVLARHCPHLHTLHLATACGLVGLDVPANVWQRAQYEIKGTQIANTDYDLQQHVLNCPSRTILNLLRPTSCPQLRHLTLDVHSIWPAVKLLYEDKSPAHKGLVAQLSNCWEALDAFPRGLIQLKLDTLQMSSKQEQKQVQAAIEALEAAWEEAYEDQAQRLQDLIDCYESMQADMMGTYESKQPGEVNWKEASWFLQDMLMSPPPSMKRNGHRSKLPVAVALKDAQLLQHALIAGVSRDMDGLVSRLEEDLQCCHNRFEQQHERLDEWWKLHGQLLRCRSNAQYAQQLHEALQPQVQQQLAALPNLSSLHIQHHGDIAAGLAGGVLQLGSQLTALKLGTADTMDHRFRFSLDQDHLNKPVMPQQLSSVCSQLTNLQQLQWDAVVRDEGMHHLLKLPHLQHVTLVTNLSQSFADVQCSWHSLTTIHSEPCRYDGNSTCKQLAYLPLASLQQPVCVVRNSEVSLAHSRPHPQLFAVTKDPGADLGIVQQACSNVARCGGVSWVYNPEAHKQDIPCIVYDFDHGNRDYDDWRKAECRPIPQQLQVLEASLALVKGPNMRTVMVACRPLNDDVISMLAPQLSAWDVHTLDIRHSAFPAEFKYYLLKHLPLCISHLTLLFDIKGRYGGPSWWSPDFLYYLCYQGQRPITIHLIPKDGEAYHQDDFTHLQVDVAKACQVAVLVPHKLLP